jgi:hypothetical protein
MNVASVLSTTIPTLSSISNDESVDQKYMKFIKEFYNVQAYQTRDEVNSVNGGVKMGSIKSC